MAHKNGKGRGSSRRQSPRNKEEKDAGNQSPNKAKEGGGAMKKWLETDKTPAKMKENPPKVTETKAAQADNKEDDTKSVGSNTSKKIVLRSPHGK